MTFTELDELFLRRAWSLAKRAEPLAIATNPPVGAVLVREDRILAEGWHQRYGGPHAEIEAIQKVPNREVLREATLYVTLEPCCHYGKTPPCTHAIQSAGIERVVVGCLDPNPRVAGQGVSNLRSAGVKVVLAPQPQIYQALLRHFAVGIRQQRPYITLKWAQLRTGTHAPLIGSRHQPQLPISGFWGRVWGHKLRSQHTHIAVGYGTWRLDKPQLTTRYFPGPSPKAIVFYDPRRGEPPEKPNSLLVPLYPLLDTLRHLYQARLVASLLVEGGAQVLQAFLSAGLYDEIHVLERCSHTASPEVEAPIWAPVAPALPWQVRKLGPYEQVRFYRKPYLLETAP